MNILSSKNVFWEKQMNKKSSVPDYSLLQKNSIKTKKKSIGISQNKKELSKDKKANQEQSPIEIPSNDFKASSSLSELRMSLAKTNLPFKEDANTMVFSDGDSESPLMLIGEAPGQEEDKQGKPFVGESGKLLESILNAANIYRRKYYITNIVPWRPPNNRTPSSEEIRLMQPYILNHIDIINPKIVILIGSVSYRAVMNETKAITTVRGEFIEKNNRLYIPIFHPSYLLRSPSKKKEMWHDILTVKNKIKELNLNILKTK